MGIINLATREARCRDCNRPVVWGLTEPRQKRVPLDPLPSPEGDRHLQRVSGDLPLVFTLRDFVLEDARKAGTPLYTVHFDTCPARHHPVRLSVVSSTTPVDDPTRVKEEPVMAMAAADTSKVWVVSPEDIGMGGNNRLVPGAEVTKGDLQSLLDALHTQKTKTIMMRLLAFLAVQKDYRIAKGYHVTQSKTDQDNHDLPNERYGTMRVYDVGYRVRDTLAERVGQHVPRDFFRIAAKAGLVNLEQTEGPGGRVTLKGVSLAVRPERLSEVPGFDHYVELQREHYAQIEPPHVQALRNLSQLHTASLLRRAPVRPVEAPEPTEAPKPPSPAAMPPELVGRMADELPPEPSAPRPVLGEDDDLQALMLGRIADYEAETAGVRATFDKRINELLAQAEAIEAERDAALADRVRQAASWRAFMEIM